MTAKSARGIMSPAFNGLQNLSDKDQKLASSITSKQRLKITSESFLILLQAAKFWTYDSYSPNSFFSISLQDFKSRWGKQNFCRNTQSNCIGSFRLCSPPELHFCISTYFALPSFYFSCVYSSLLPPSGWTPWEQALCPIHLGALYHVGTQYLRRIVGTQRMLGTQ